MDAKRSVQSVQGADGAWFRAQVLLALSCGGGILLR